MKPEVKNSIRRARRASAKKPSQSSEFVTFLQRMATGVTKVSSDRMAAKPQSLPVAQGEHAEALRRSQARIESMIPRVSPEDVAEWKRIAESAAFRAPLTKRESLLFELLIHVAACPDFAGARASHRP